MEISDHRWLHYTTVDGESGTGCDCSVSFKSFDGGKCVGDAIRTTTTRQTQEDPRKGMLVEHLTTIFILCAYEYVYKNKIWFNIPHNFTTSPKLKMVNR